jgi:hypothetical protein
MYITINSEFKPFTYDELTKPLNDYTEAYNKVEEQYATLAQQTEAWKNIATQENSPEAYAMYKKYSDELNDVVEDFSRGMTIQNRSKLAGLKSRYASEITPIANAYNAMQEANKYRETVRAKDGSAIFVKDRYNSLDDFLNGNQADNTFISGDEIQKNVTARVLSQSYTDYNNLINSGIKPDKAVQIVASGNNQSIADIIADEQSSLGIDSFDTQGQAKLNNAILAGVQQGLGSFASKEYMSREERDASARGWANLEESKKQHAIDLEMHGYNKDGTINPNSPYWSMQGIKWTSSKDGTLIPIVGTKPGTNGGDSKDTKRGFITSEKRSFNLDGEIQGSGDSVDLKGSTQVNYSDLNTEEKNIVDKQIGEDGDISAFEFYVIRDVWRDANKRVIIVPKKSIILNNDDKGDNDL